MNTICIRCQSPISNRRQRYGAKFCTNKCSYQHQKEKYVRYRTNDSVSHITVGAISELFVAVDLMKRGYHVFRSLSSACPCDLAILKDDKTLIRVEVTTGRKFNGKVMHNKLSKSARYDLLAVVIGDDEIYYTPEEF